MPDQVVLEARFCACGCGKEVTSYRGRQQKWYNAACRERMRRRQQRAERERVREFAKKAGYNPQM